MSELNACDIRMLKYQLQSGPMSVQVVAPFREITFHDSVADVERRVEALEAREPSAIYTSLNHSTGTGWPTNASVPQRDRILVEVDPGGERPTGFCATDAEVALAFGVIERAREYLFARGVSRNGTALALSGNGPHFILFCNWICDPRSDAAITGLLRGLSVRFSTSEAAIDTSVGDGRRITKLYGCQTRKKAAEGRPQRRSHVLEMPEQIELVPLEVVEEIVRELGATIQIRTTGDATLCPGAQTRFVKNFTRFAQSIGGEITKIFTRGDGRTILITRPCLLFDHVGGIGAVGITSDGIRCVQCFTDKCKSLGWAAWARAVELRHGKKMWLDGEIIWKK